MNRFGLVDIVKDGCEGGGFTGTGRASDEDQAGFFARDLLDYFGELQPLKGGNNGV